MHGRKAPWRRRESPYFDHRLTRATLTADGVETIFATNHLGPYLLTNLLLDTMERSSPARILNVAS